MTQATAGSGQRRAHMHVTQRDVDGLMMCGEHGGVPYDLLGAALGVQPARLRGITARWRRAGYAATGPLGPGPAWCWLTPAGMEATGQRYKPGPPRLARLAHVRAVLAARLWLASLPDWQQGRPWYQSERRITRHGPFGGTHRPDAELWWPYIEESPHPDQVWAVEVELTAKNAARTAAVINGYAAAGYTRVLYFTAPPARTVVTRCAQASAAPVTVCDLPPSAAFPA
jgi:hypothetical protein